MGRSATRPLDGFVWIARGRLHYRRSWAPATRDAERWVSREESSTMTEVPRVLVVDDDPAFLAYVRDGLASAVTVVARTPLEALWHLERDRFGAVMCDLVFGDVDGRHLLEVVRE